MVSIAKGDILVGQDIGAHDFEITPELVATYMVGTDDPNPWYTGPSPFDAGPSGAAVAPALVLHSEVYRFGGWYLKNIFGNLHAKQEWDLFAPMMVGDTVTTHSTVIDRYIKRGRDYVVNEVQVYGEGGRLLSRARTHQSFLLDESTEGFAVDKSREKKKRTAETGGGDFVEEIAPLEKPVSIDMCKTFSPGVTYHNDADAAKKLGFPDIVVQGMMTVCFLSELMTLRFGEGWYSGGRMSVNLVNVLWGEDGGVTCKGVIREYTSESSARRAHCEIWAEKADGTKVIAGTASAVV
ncbi:MAG: MaoC family dehydratase N-terminal domain-containing protein [Chloroflexi bacterium]|nr:MaoC family dehydratase N-terminal domain-containing protein [Chloroflexota bacterium]